MPSTELSPGKRLFFWTLIASLALTAAIAIAVLLFADFDETTGRILMTTALVSVTSLLALPGGVLLDQGRFRALAWIDLALSGALLVFATAVVWSTSADPREDVLRTLASLAVATAAFAQVTAVTSRLRREDAPRVRGAYVASLALVSLVALMAWVGIWAEPDDESFFRVLAALVVANLFVVLVQPILRKTAPQGRAPYRLAFTLDREPPPAAVDDARAALERAGVTVERTDAGA